MKLIQYKLGILILILFSSCKKERVEKKSVFIKTWYDTERVVPYTATLIINKDHTFKFTGGACTARFYSNGKWIEKKDTLILNSGFPKECLNLREFGRMCYSNEEIENIRFLKTKAGCEVKNDDEFENFRDAKFYLRNDSLIFKKDKKENCTEYEIRFYKAKKVR